MTMIVNAGQCTVCTVIIIDYNHNRFTRYRIILHDCTIRYNLQIKIEHIICSNYYCYHPFISDDDDDDEYVVTIIFSPDTASFAP
mmetsp:Transcript_17363/g.19443  ORF Transcript_17363/g.19443 Transcript_17363/m.19443 type:complete len:85 (+) Transcript_17363:635-889(+)